MTQKDQSLQRRRRKLYCCNLFRHKLTLKTHKTSHKKMKFHHDGRKCNLFFGKNRLELYHRKERKSLIRKQKL